MPEAGRGGAEQLRLSPVSSKGISKFALQGRQEGHAHGTDAYGSAVRSP